MQHRLSALLLAQNGPVQIAPDLYIYKQPSVLDLYEDSPISKILDNGELNMLSIPYTGFGYTIMEYGFLLKAIQAYSLWRLDDIRQLGLLEDPDTPVSELSTSAGFNHTRFCHSLDVMTIVSVIAHNNSLWFERHPGHGKVLRLAALTHDVLTPAGGDTTKSIDSNAFDEDVMYPDVLKRKSVQIFCTSQDIDTELLIKTICGEGVLGSILDIADKLAYTARDLHNFEGSVSNWPHDWEQGSPLRHELTPLATRHLPLGVWSSINVDDEGVVVTDSAKLATFLSIRALMFRNLYTHPCARYHESLLMRTILLFLYETELLTRDMLLTMTDIDLYNRVHEVVDCPHQNRIGYYHATYRTFDSLDEARFFEQTLVTNGTLFAQTEVVDRFFKPGTHFRVSTQNGFSPFCDVYPDKAIEIESLGSAIDPIRVYYLDGKQPTFKSEMQQAFKKWRLEKVSTT